MYLKCSSNNRANTVFNLFVTACNNIGIPSRVRSDSGGENVLVATFMSLYHGVGWGSHIAGTSVHNTTRGLSVSGEMSCTSLFYHLFHSLEDCGLLDPESDIHLLCLAVCVSAKNKQIVPTFGGNHGNQHPLTSCNCMTPQQLWMRGMLQNIHSGYTAVNDFLSNIPYRHYHCLTQDLFLTLSQKEMKSGQLQFH